MKKRFVYFLLISVMLLLISVTMSLIPDPVKPFVSLASPALFVTTLAAILCGSTYAFGVGFLSPVFVFLLLGEGNFLPDVLVPALAYSVTGFAVGFFYDWKRQMVISVVLSIVASRAMVGLICFVYYLSIGHYYTLGDYLAYAFGDVWLGLLLTLFGVPALVYWLGKTGILRLLGKDFSYS